MGLPWFVQNPDPSIYLGDNYLVLDVETTNLESGSPYEPQNRLLLACWVRGDGHPNRRGRGRASHKWGSEFEQSELLEDIERADFIVCHHTKFELGWLSRCGADLRAILPYCTQIGEYVIAGNRKYKDGLGLAASCARNGIPVKSGWIPAAIQAGVCPSELPPRQLLAYCVEDVDATEQLFLRQRRVLESSGLLPVTYCRNLVTPVLADMEPVGMHLDEQRVRKAHAEYATKYAAVLAEFNEITGGINPKSGKQMREYLYGTLKFEEATDHRGEPLRTAGGKKGTPQPRTDKLVLPLLKARTPEQKRFKALAIEVAKLKVPLQNLEKMVKLLDKGQPVVYGIINQTITGTHRFSSSGRKGGFQFQNFDRAFKPLFSARKDDWVMVEADAPQLEFRCGIHMSGDTKGRKAIIEGLDVHALTAAVYKVPRQEAKARTFAPMYGAQGATAQEKAYRDAFREAYPDLFATQTEWTYKVARDKQLRIPSGLIFYWPDAKMTNRGFITNTTQIFNYPIQSFATADIIPLTLVLVWHHIAELDAAIINTIHDSIVLECSQQCLESLVDILVDCYSTEIYPLLERLYGIKFSVPLGVGIKHGTHWSEGTETKYEPTTRNF